MSWLTPISAVYAGAIVVPTLVLLYFLKLKRREEVVSSTLLWRRAVHDLQVNAPFQKIRRNILLLLQLLALLAILAAIGGPIALLTGGPGQRYVILVDRSASMNATDIAPTRLDAAKAEARLLIESLRKRTPFSLWDSSDQAMIIAFADHAKIMCSFTSDRQQLLAALEAITPSDASSALGEAVTVAQAFAQSPGEETNNRSSETPAQLVLFSDGRIRDSEAIVVGAEEVVFNCVGESGRNIAITAMQASRSYDKPDEVTVFATATNYGEEAANCDIQLSIDGNVRALRTVSLPARHEEDDETEMTPGKAAVSFTLSNVEAGIVEVRQLQSDALSCDDATWAVIAPPRKLSVLMVSSGNMVLESALRACPLGKFEVLSPSEFEALDHDLLNIAPPYDVIVLDNCIPARLPRASYLVFGRPPGVIDVTVTRQLENQMIVDWRASHPVLKYVDPENLFAAKCYEMNLPRDAEVLAEFNEGAAIALVRRKMGVFVLAGFDVLETNWPFEPSFVLFCYNAMNYLGVQFEQGQDSDLRVGQPMVYEGVGAGTEARVEGPGGEEMKIKANPSGTVRFAGTDRAGIYSLSLPDLPVKYFAVNALDGRESDIRPVREMSFAGQAVEAEEGAVRRSNQPLWPYLVMLALLVCALEWYVYNSKIRL